VNSSAATLLRPAGSRAMTIAPTSGRKTARLKAELSNHSTPSAFLL
jgi:hypothetical protein